MKLIPQSITYPEISNTVVSHGAELPKPIMKTVTWNNQVGEGQNPRWKSQVIARQEAGTAHSSTWQSMSISPYGGSYTSVATRKTRIFLYAPPTRAYPAAVKDAVASDIDAQCIGSFRSKVQSLAQELSGPTFLGELRSTVMMIKRPSLAFYRSVLRYLRWCNREIKSFRKKRRKNPKALQSRINSKYLEYTFGWIPLMSDIEGGIKALSNFRKTKSDYATVVKSVEIPAVTTVTSSTLDQHRLTTTSSAKATYSVKCYGKIRGDLIGLPGSYNRLKNSLGFTWKEFLPTMWNLLPFSFVVDYFANINELLLSSYSSSASLVYSGMTRFATSEVNVSTKVTRHGSALVTAWTAAPGSRYQQIGSFSRSIGIAVLVPKVSLPGFRQAINIAALVKAFDDNPFKKTPPLIRNFT